MILPRIIFEASFSTENNDFDSITNYFQQNGKAVFYQTKGLPYGTVSQKIHKLKKLCLHYNGFLILDDLKAAAAVSADAVIVDFEDEKSSKYLDLLEEKVIIGTDIDSVAQIVELCDLGMADMVLLGRGKAKAFGEIKTILADIQILGYDIPIYVHGDVNDSAAVELLKQGCYGIGFSKLGDFEEISRRIAEHPLR